MLSITAIIPLYNGKKFIRAALESVLAQERAADEIIVVDDGSTDDGATIVQEMATSHPSIKLLSKPNGGQSSARNFGVRHSTGDLIALLDQDDLWYPHHLRLLEVPFSEPHSLPLGWVYSNLDYADINGRMVCREVLSTLRTNEHPKQSVEACLRQDMFVLPGASLISRAAFDKVGGFDEQFVGYEDDDLFLRLFCAGFRNVYLKEALTMWRMHSTSTSFSVKMARSRVRFFEKLVKEFPDQPDMMLFYVKNLIAPRFTKTAMVELINAVNWKDRQRLDLAQSQIWQFSAPMPTGRRLVFRSLAFLLSINLVQSIYRSTPHFIRSRLRTATQIS